MQKLLAAADTINLKPTTGNFVGLGNLTVPQVVSALIRFVVVIAALVFFFILVIGGIRWIASGGDKAQTEAARNQITAALVGLVIVFAAWAIVALINTFFGIDIFSLAIPTV
jgi:TRAP-type C4-dicarboxylate transport system permease small subunit